MTEEDIRTMAANLLTCYSTSCEFGTLLKFRQMKRSRTGERVEYYSYLSVAGILPETHAHRKRYWQYMGIGMYEIWFTSKPHMEAARIPYLPSESQRNWSSQPPGMWVPVRTLEFKLPAFRSLTTFSTKDLMHTEDICKEAEWKHVVQLKPLLVEAIRKEAQRHECTPA